MLTEDAKFQRTATMSAVPVKKTNRATSITKKHQRFTEHVDRQRQLIEFTCQCDRLPKTAKIFAAITAMLDMR